MALVSDVDDLDQQQDAVTLITLHAAKGLEFPIVFLIGMEEGLMPHSRSFDDPAQMEEERRLCYVGITRARERLYLTHAYRRSTWGASAFNPVSRYLADIPATLTTTRSRVDGHAAPRSAAMRERIIENAVLPMAPARPRGKTEFARGDVVRHPKFGEGIVLSTAPRGEDAEVTVIFKGAAGTKKLLASFAFLERASV